MIGAARCVDCDEVVDPMAPGTMVEVIGFAEHRKQGGQNHVWFREETGRFLCPEHAMRRKHGVASTQETLA